MQSNYNNGVFPKWNGNSVKSGNQRSMKYGKFKDAVSHLCLAGTAVPSWSLTLEIVGSNPFVDKYFSH